MRLDHLSTGYRIARIILYCLFTWLLISMEIAATTTTPTGPPKKQVLVLHGLWRIRTWEIPFNATLHRLFLADQDLSVGINHVYLGLDEYPQGGYPYATIEALQERVSTNPVDLVISVLPSAGRFLHIHGPSLFPGVPLIAVLPDGRDMRDLTAIGASVISSDGGRMALEKTLAAIHTLLPETATLVVVAGGGDLDHQFLGSAEAAIETVAPTMAVHYLIGTPLDTLWSQVTALPVHSAILFTTYDRDRLGRKHHTADVVQQLTARANAPVFGFVDTLLGTGIVGGCLTRADDLARATALTALAELKQGPPEDVPVPVQGPNFGFDATALKRWQIPQARLPEGSRIINSQPSVWTAYKRQIMVGLGVLLVQALLILLLVANLVRVRRIKRALSASEARYRTLHDNIPVGIYRTQGGRLVSLNPAALAMFGLDSTTDAAGYTPTDLYLNPLRRKEALAALAADGELREFEIQFKRRDGALFWGALSATRVSATEGDKEVIDGIIQDITERKQAEAQLLREKRFSEAILDSLPGIFYMYDDEYRLVRWNQARNIGAAYTDVQLRHLSLDDFFDGQDLEKVRHGIDQVFTQGQTSLEAQIINEDGSKTPYFFTGARLTLESGRYALGIGIDLTERLRMETSLRNSERRLADIINFLPDATFVIDTDGKVVAWNRAIEALSGVSAAEMVGRGDYAYAVPFYGERRPCMIDLALRWDEAAARSYDNLQRHGEILVSETVNPHFRPKPSLFWNSARKLHNSDGEVVGAIEVIRDITDRKLAHDALRESEERYRTLFHSANDAIFIIKDQTIVECNEKTLEIFRCSREDIIGHLPSKFSPRLQPDGTPSMEKLLATTRAARQGDPQEFEWLHKRLDGSFFEVRVNLNMVMLRNGPHIQAIVRDITERKQAEAERKRLEAQLYQAQKMEAIGTLAGGIAHDFNNILAAIIGFTEVSLRGVTDGSKLASNLQRVLNAANRAGDLVKQILTFSRQSQKTAQPLQIKPIAKEALRLLRASLPTTIEIRQQMHSERFIQADPTQVHQIVMNLCTNAAHALPDEVGVIEVRLSDLDGAERPGGQPTQGPLVRLSVRDSGSGIPTDIQDRLFDPFFTTKAQGKGTGLGLSVVHGIVEDCGGWITLESEPGKGSTFELYFPAIAGEPVRQRVAASPLPGGSERILFVDDEEAQVSLAKAVLEPLGYGVVGTTRSDEALTMFQAAPHRFDLLITDLTMPVMTGDLLAREIRSLRPDMPVILCTGYSEKVGPENAAEMGIQAIMMKPAAVAMMANTVRRVLDRAHGIDGHQRADAAGDG
ncbi:MAG: PAS domain S-box protein [Desulfosarcinaceae bacterium]|nr:PAS domain S-box protein [Desulfosarcinaceae bacterium]